MLGFVRCVVLGVLVRFFKTVEKIIKNFFGSDIAMQTYCT